MFTNEDIERVARVLRETLWNYGVQLTKEMDEALARAVIEAMYAIPVCEECGVYRADPPSKICVGCQAYREHTGHF